MSEWIKNNGEMPVAPGVLVDTQWKSGDLYSFDRADAWMWRDENLTYYRLSEQTAEEAYEDVEKGVLNQQIGGNHYERLGDYQPWKVLKAWLTPEEFRGYMKGNAIVYLARERDKGGRQDIEKGCHTLQGYLELESE